MEAIQTQLVQLTPPTIAAIFLGGILIGIILAKVGTRHY